jgi:hypothetical protein
MARNSRVEEHLVDQLFNSSEKRLARFAADIVNRVLPDDPAAEAAVNHLDKRELRSSWTERRLAGACVSLSVRLFRLPPCGKARPD